MRIVSSKIAKYAIVVSTAAYVAMNIKEAMDVIYEESRRIPIKGFRRYE